MSGVGRHHGPRSRICTSPPGIQADGSVDECKGRGRAVAALGAVQEGTTKLLQSTVEPGHPGARSEPIAAVARLTGHPRGGKLHERAFAKWLRAVSAHTRNSQTWRRTLKAEQLACSTLSNGNCPRVRLFARRADSDMRSSPELRGWGGPVYPGSTLAQCEMECLLWFVDRPLRSGPRPLRY